MFKIDPNFWDDVEDATKLKYVVYGDTDSLYTNIPSIKYKDSKDATEQATKIAVEINDIILKLLNEFLLPKMGVDKKYNKTYFKIESVISQMMFLDIKKNYAYKELSKKGRIYDQPKIEYTGIPVVRSDYSKFAQEFIRRLIEDIALTESDNKLELLNDLAKNMYERVIRDSEDLEFHFIGTPGRWKEGSYKKETFTLIGMRLYNTIYEEEIFRPGLNGLSIPIDITNISDFLEKINNTKNKSKLFLNNVSTSNITYLVVPTNYNKEDLKEKIEYYNLKIDFQSIWEKNFSKIARDIVELIKAEMH